MPKATLEFNLPEERDEFRDAQNGGTWRMILQDVDNQLRNVVKYGEPKEALAKTTQGAYDQVRTWIYEICQNNNLNLHE